MCIVPLFSICQEIWMNIRKWKDSPALKETRDMLETKLEDKKVRGILNWIFQIAVVLIFGILAGIALFQSVTVQESAMEPTLQVGERFFVTGLFIKYPHLNGETSLYIKPVEVMMRLCISAAWSVCLVRLYRYPTEQYWSTEKYIMKIRIFLKSVMRDWHPTECLWKAVSILYLAITEITVRTAGMVISEISIRNILWERYGLSFPRKINLDF